VIALMVQYREGMKFGEWRLRLEDGTAAEDKQAVTVVRSTRCRRYSRLLSRSPPVSGAADGMDECPASRFEDVSPVSSSLEFIARGAGTIGAGPRRPRSRRRCARHRIKRPHDS
jgi:hypothetical protein